MNFFKSLLSRKSQPIYNSRWIRIDAQLNEIIKVLENTFDTPEIRVFASMINDSGNINFQDANGNTILIMAITYSKPDLIDIILDYHETDINLPNKNWLTPLMIAVMYSKQDDVYKLINKSWLAINAQNEDWITALMLSVDPEITRLLLLHPDIDVDIQDSQGKTALDIAMHDEDDFDEEWQVKIPDSLSQPQIVQVLMEYIRQNTSNDLNLKTKI